MAKFRSGNLVLQSTQTITQGGITVLDTARGGRFTSLKLDAELTTIIDEFSIDGTLIDNSDTALPTEQAVKTYVDNKIAGSIGSGIDNRVARYDGADSIQSSGLVLGDDDSIYGSQRITIGNSQIEYPAGTTQSGSNVLELAATQGVRMCTNDGSGNFLQYLNAYNDNPGGGHKFIYEGYAAIRNSWTHNGGIVWSVSDAVASDSTGELITWVDAISINDTDGRVTIGQEMTINGEDSAAGYLYAGTTDPSNTDRLNYDGHLYVTKLFNAVWNDIADFQKINGEKIPGKCYFDTIDGAEICTERCQKSVIGILSDTYGFGVGGSERPDNGPFAIAGWVLAYVADECEPGDPLTNDEDGNLSKMTEVEKALYPERLIAIYKKPETKTVWGTEDTSIEVKGRHWVKVK